MNEGLYRLVYEYYETRILYGFYVEGDRLPSICAICTVFSMASATVRSALKQLEKKGYIRVDARKAAVVIYQADSSRFRQNAAEYFVRRKEGISDLLQSGRLLFEPLWRQGILQWSEGEWELLRKRLTAPEPGTKPMPAEFYLAALNVFHNRLLINLYWEMIRYLHFPYLTNQEERELVKQDLGNESKEEILTYLDQRLEQKNAQAVQTLFQFIEQAETEYALNPPAQIPFHWNIYRQRPQLRYSLASRMIREIIEGRYPAGTFLPSLSQMTEQYGVTWSTARRTVELLEKLGSVRARQGKGVEVRAEVLLPDLAQPDIREGLRLYQESLQFLALTIRTVIVCTLEHTEPSERKMLAEKLLRLQSDQKSYLGFEVILSFLEQECPLALVRECYGKIRELLTWGYPFSKMRVKRHNLHEEYAQLILSAGIHLKEKKILAFAQDWEELMIREESQIRTLVDESGNPAQ